MGYESRAVIAVDNTIYTDVTWGEDKPEDINTHGDRTFYSFEWDKGVERAVLHFLDNIAKKDEDGDIIEENYGIIIIGEELDDIVTYGEWWEFDMELVRSIVIY
jgi:hypothetical protein